jgi:hypothetical protein
VSQCRNTRDDEGRKKHKIENHRKYFRSFSGKLNFAPPSYQSEWFKIVNVPLANGDNVGVVERWQHPGARDADLTTANIEAIKQAVSGGEWRESWRADVWVGKAIAPILGLDPDDDREVIRKVIRDLIAAHVLRTVQGKTDQRKPCLLVVVNDGFAPVNEPTAQNEEIE